MKTIILLFFLLNSIISTMAQNDDITIRNKYEFIITHSDSLKEEFYNSLLEKYPYSGYLIGMKAYNLIYQNRTKEAEAFLQKKITSNKSLMNNTFVLMSLGLVYDNTKNNHDSKLKLLFQSIKEDTFKINKWVRLELFYELKEIDEHQSWNYLNEALQMDPDFTVALIVKSFNLNPIIDCEQIILLLEKVITRYQSSDVFFSLGNAYYNCNNFTKAEYYLLKSVNLKSNFNAYFTLAQIEQYQKKDYNKALEMYKQAIKLDSSNIEVLIGIGWLYYDIKKFDVCEAIFQKIIQLGKDQENYNPLIIYYLKKKNYLFAEKFIKESIEINGLNFFNEGFYLILELTQTDQWKNLKDKILNYEKKYSIIEADWLRGLIEEIQYNAQ